MFNPMTFSPWEMVTALAVVAMLILNLSLRNAVATLKVAFEKDLAGVQLQVANLRAELIREHSDEYRELMKAIADSFIPRREAEAMHDANIERMTNLQNEVHALSVKVGDIS